MKITTKFSYEDVQEILREHVIANTMESVLEDKEIEASAPYGDYVVTIEKIRAKEKEN